MDDGQQQDEEEEKRGQSARLGSAPARLLCLLRARLVALGGVPSQGASRLTGRPANALGARANRFQSH